MRHGQLCELGPPFFDTNRDGDRPDAFLEHDLRFVACERNGANGGQDVCGSDGGMAGELQLAARREDSDSRGMARVVGRQDECRLGVVELPRDVWHKVRGDFARVGKDGELISAEASIGENVGGEIAGVHVGKV